MPGTLVKGPARSTAALSVRLPPSLLLLPAVLLVAAASLATGPAQVEVGAGLRDWLIGESTQAALVIGEIRLPRTLLALAVGAALGLSGAALQGLLRNPLADPGLSGASQGAALGAASVFYYGFFPAAGMLAGTVAALIGAGLTLAVLLWIAGPAHAPALVLAGLALSTLTGALLATVLNFAPNPFAMQELVFWLLGSVAERGMPHVATLAPALVVGGMILARERAFLAALSLGEEVAQSLGFTFAAHSRRVVTAAALLVGAAVSVAGAIGFVGLVVPHLLRPWVGYRPDRLLAPSALAGAILVCLADILVRQLPPDREIKLGVITALVGSPFFLWLVWRERRAWH